MLTPEYGYVLLVSCLMGFEVLIIGFLLPGRARAKVFSEQFMRDNFSALHSQNFQEPVMKGGYPDMGSGVYSQKLSYKDWYEFNNAQRGHQNFVEWIATHLILLLVAGIYYPQFSAALGAVNVIARGLFAFGYASGGPQKRLVGALINDAAVMVLFILSIISSFKWIGAQHF